MIPAALAASLPSNFQFSPVKEYKKVEEDAIASIKFQIDEPEITLSKVNRILESAKMSRAQFMAHANSQIEATRPPSNMFHAPLNKIKENLQLESLLVDDPDNNPDFQRHSRNMIDIVGLATEGQLENMAIRYKRILEELPEQKTPADIRSETEGILKEMEIPAELNLSVDDVLSRVFRGPIYDVPV